MVAKIFVFLEYFFSPRVQLRKQYSSRKDLRSGEFLVARRQVDLQQNWSLFFFFSSFPAHRHDNRAAWQISNGPFRQK